MSFAYATDLIRLVQLGRRSQCVRYDGSKPPGLFRIWGQDFNYSHVPPASALLHGHGVVMAASGNITRCTTFLVLVCDSQPVRW